MNCGPAPAKIRFIPAYAGNARFATPETSAWAVHPRVCGERVYNSSVTGQLSGSSPRMRGTRCRSRAVGGSARFIPAYAGNARPQWPRCCRRAVHPRVCGERPSAAYRARGQCGSSPRMRGTLRNYRPSRPSVRFIPAYAGNASELPTKPSLRPVHPRVCGERVLPAATFEFHRGSSPRMRGTHNRRFSGATVCRFIPAYAGNAQPANGEIISAPVHPRVCGERDQPMTEPELRSGSSPRMRGTLNMPVYQSGHHRFIPAYAGNAPHPVAIACIAPVHPRVCGERRSKTVGMIFMSGSSPRMRGTQQIAVFALESGRFIPAYAGNALEPGFYNPYRSVHPRVCGERSDNSSAE